MDTISRWYQTAAKYGVAGWERITNLDFDLKTMMTAHACLEIPVGVMFLIGRPALLFAPLVLTGAEADAFLSNPAMVILMRWFGCAVLSGGLTALLLRNAIPKKTHDVVIYGIALYHALLTALSLGHRYDFSDIFVPLFMPACHGLLALGFATVAALGGGKQSSLGSSASDRTARTARTALHIGGRQHDSRRYDPFKGPDPYAAMSFSPASHVMSTSSVKRMSNAVIGMGTAIGAEVERAMDHLDPFVGDSFSEDGSDTVSSGGSSTSSGRRNSRVLYPIDDTPNREELPVGRLASCLSESNSMMLESADGSSREGPRAIGDSLC